MLTAPRPKASTFTWKGSGNRRRFGSSEKISGISNTPDNRRYKGIAEYGPNDSTFR
jgi:hypothetical protein